MRQLVTWLGPQRARLVLALLMGVGLGSLVLQTTFSAESWVFSAQLALIWLLFVGLAVLLDSRLPPNGRRKLRIALIPGLLLLGLGVLLPDWGLFFAGGGLGWMVAAQIVLRNRMQMEYQIAIRHLRRSEFAEAIAAMKPLIQAEPNDPNHHRFRAELYRLSGNLGRAVKDYEKVVQLAPQMATGYTGLAEVYAQQGQYERARAQARQALMHEPYQWMTAYNLGMIEDRLEAAEDAVKHLEQALESGVPHSRYRLLTHLWLARNYARLGETEKAHQHLDRLRQQARGLQEWQVVFASDQAAPLRTMLEQDVALAESLAAESETSLEKLLPDGR